MSDHYVSRRPPLAPDTFTPLPLGAIKPEGWLRDQLRVQADGLTGHLDEFWPDVARSKWIGGDAEGWERGPYWLDGLVPLAVLLEDDRLFAKAGRWVDYILGHQHEDGWFGPKQDPHEGSGQQVLDPWPQSVLFKALTQWDEATGDGRVVPALSRAMRRIGQLLEAEPLHNWAKMRWPDLSLSLLYVYDRTGEEWLLDLARLVERQGYDWRAHFADFTLTEKQTQWNLENHVVNHAMAFKEYALRHALSGATDVTDLRAAAYQAMETLDAHHGQVTGVFTGDESLAGPQPTQGTELCAVVEYLFSLEILLAAFGEAPFADRLERIAFNALPATSTPDMWAHQYDQQVNQVLCSVDKRAWTNNNDESNTYGLEPNFGCCTANLHQGWPKLTSHLWMTSGDGGLVATAYAPSQVTATVANGQKVTVTEETEYPFREDVRFTVRTEAPVRFPLRLRIPAWALGASVQQPGLVETVLPGGWYTIDREWKDGDAVRVHLPMVVRTERRPATGAVSILRGPLVFGLRIGEEFRVLKGTPPRADFAVHPTTPWNYGLMLPKTQIEEDRLSVREAPLGPVPFVPESAPVVLTARAKRIPTWTLEQNSAGPIPQSPVASDEPVEQVELIPYGSTNLRIAEFPEIAE